MKPIAFMKGRFVAAAVSGAFVRDTDIAGYSAVELGLGFYRWHANRAQL